MLHDALREIVKNGLDLRFSEDFCGRAQDLAGDGMFDSSPFTEDDELHVFFDLLITEVNEDLLRLRLQHQSLDEWKTLPQLEGESLQQWTQGAQSDLFPIDILGGQNLGGLYIHKTREDLQSVWGLSDTPDEDAIGGDNFTDPDCSLGIDKRGLT